MMKYSKNQSRLRDHKNMIGKSIEEEIKQANILTLSKKEART
jgi:hypothetical protein